MNKIVFFFKMNIVFKYSLINTMICESLQKKFPFVKKKFVSGVWGKCYFWSFEIERQSLCVGVWVNWGFSEG